MIGPDTVVAQARRWIGTPYRHQCSMRAAGCDCLGLICGIWRALYGDLPEQVPAYTPDWAEASGEERLWRAARRHLIPVQDAPAPGQVLLFQMRRGAVAKHLGIVSRDGPAPAFIHAYSGHGVVESPLSRPWRDKIVAQFIFPQGAV
ncbi:peptidase [Thioclava sp. SK-1]|uniref:peptidase n=1 Tax=Thioclava sp. SK-1 TaxID=1889770 RepID=UPI000826151F|nr:peptidase [Thioclava sp. SK-1]OCX67039.1 peptidase [Thioclava sp. SK-1]